MNVICGCPLPPLALFQAAVARVSGSRLDGGGAALAQELEMEDYEKGRYRDVQVKLPTLKNCQLELS